MTDTQAQQDYAAWRQQRLDYVRGARGPLSLVETRWFAPGTSKAEAQRLQAEQTAAAAAEATTATVTVTAMERISLHTETTEYGLRVWRSDAKAQQLFETLAAFDYNSEWVLEGEFTPGEGEVTVPFEHMQERGTTRNLVIPGTVKLTHLGESFELSGFVSGDKLLVPVADKTTGAAGDLGTYAPMRFVPVVGAEATENFTASGKVVIDFNYAYVPPCGFSAQFNCPIAPASNRLPWAIYAGEKRPVFADGVDVHTLT